MEQPEGLPPGGVPDYTRKDARCVRPSSRPSPLRALTGRRCCDKRWYAELRVLPGTKTAGADQHAC